MSQTLEERISRELDELYQGALFLSAGRKRRAEDLTVEAVGCATVEELPASADFPRYLGACLVRAFLARGGAAAVEPPPDADDLTHLPDALAASLASIGPGELYNASAKVPPRARATIWLVLLKRWSHADAAGALGVERQELRDLLRYRRVLWRELAASAPGSGGAAGVGS